MTIYKIGTMCRINFLLNFLFACLLANERENSMMTILSFRKAQSSNFGAEFMATVWVAVILKSMGFP
jgi:hypothetical protein